MSINLDAAAKMLYSMEPLRRLIMQAILSSLALPEASRGLHVGCGIGLQTLQLAQAGRAYNGLHFYFLCAPVTSGLIADEQVLDGSAENPRWVMIGDLKSEDFQHAGEKVLAICSQEQAAYSVHGHGMIRGNHENAIC